MNRHCVDDTFAGFDLPPEVRYGGRVFEGAGVIMPPATVADNIKRGTDAMKRVIASKSDETHAMFRKELGWIAFLWGTPGKAPPEFQNPDDMKKWWLAKTIQERLDLFKHGGGVSHIIAKRDWEGKYIKPLLGQKGVDVAMSLVEVIAKGIVNSQQQKAMITYGKYKVILKKWREEKGVRDNNIVWLLTGFEAIQDKEKKYKLIYETAGDSGICLVGTESTHIDTGYCRSNMGADSLDDLTLPLPPSAVKPVFESAYDWRAAIDEATTLNEIRAVWERLFPKPVNASFYNGIDAPFKLVESNNEKYSEYTVYKSDNGLTVKFSKISNKKYVTVFHTLSGKYLWDAGGEPITSVKDVLQKLQDLGKKYNFRISEEESVSLPEKQVKQLYAAFSAIRQQIKQG